MVQLRVPEGLSERSSRTSSPVQSDSLRHSQSSIRAPFDPQLYSNSIHTTWWYQYDSIELWWSRRFCEELRKALVIPVCDWVHRGDFVSRTRYQSFEPQLPGRCRDTRLTYHGAMANERLL